jgi:hypothetical protein
LNFTQNNFTKVYSKKFNSNFSEIIEDSYDETADVFDLLDKAEAIRSNTRE